MACSVSKVSTSQRKPENVVTLASHHLFIYPFGRGERGTLEQSGLLHAGDGVLVCSFFCWSASFSVELSLYLSIFLSPFPFISLCVEHHEKRRSPSKQQQQQQHQATNPPALLRLENPVSTLPGSGRSEHSSIFRARSPLVAVLVDLPNLNYAGGICALLTKEQQQHTKPPREHLQTPHQQTKAPLFLIIRCTRQVLCWSFEKFPLYLGVSSVSGVSVLVIVSPHSLTGTCHQPIQDGCLFSLFGFGCSANTVDIDS